MITIAHFEVTAKCFLKCIMCPVNKPGEFKREETMMDFELFKDTINNCPSLTAVGLNNWGEPLLHPNIIDMVQFCTDKGLDTIFSTNAHLLTEQMSKDLINAGLNKIWFSIDGMGETYKRIRGAELPLKNIETFLSLNNNKIYTYLGCVIMEENEQEKKDIIEYWKPKVNEFVFQNKLMFEKSNRNSVCQELFNPHLVVLSDGNVVPCCADYNGTLIIGNVKQNNLNEIHESIKLKHLRLNQQSNIFEGACLTCKEYSSKDTKNRF